MRLQGKANVDSAMCNSLSSPELCEMEPDVTDVRCISLPDTDKPSFQPWSDGLWDRHPLEEVLTQANQSSTSERCQSEALSLFFAAQDFSSLLLFVRQIQFIGPADLSPLTCFSHDHAANLGLLIPCPLHGCSNSWKVGIFARSCYSFMLQSRHSSN